MISVYVATLILVTFAQCNTVKCIQNFNVFDKIKSGFKMAGEFFSSDHASKVANLVSNALGGKSIHGKSKENSNNLFSGFLRLFGFESRQISAIAVNAIILMSQLISSSLKPSTKQKQKRIKEDDKPFDWMIRNSIISDIITDTEDLTLSENIIDYVTERSVDEETGCLQLLICKIKPFILEMQRAIKERNKTKKNVKGYGVLFEYFPNATVIADNGDKCEKKYYFCSIPL